MNSTAMTRLTHAVMIVATLAAIVMVMPVRAAQPAATQAVVTLPRVEVIGRRVVELPRVTVVGHRQDASDKRQARRDEAPAKAQRTLIAMR